MAKKPLSLEDLIPTPAEFYLSKTKKTYKLRAFSIEDSVYLLNKYGRETVDKMLTTSTAFLDKCIIAYLLFSDEDRADFPYEEIEHGIDEEGRPVKNKALTGPQKLSKAVYEVKEVQDLTMAVLRSIGISQPILDRLKIEQSQKKSRPKRRTGKK